MSVPPSQPPQGPWPPPPSGPGQPPNQPPGQAPPPYAPAPGQYSGWPPSGPPKKNNALKWALGAVALIAVIAVAVAVTLAVTRGGSGGNPNDGRGSQTPPGIASADDTGPVTVITDEPTCAKLMPINDGLANQEHNGWDKRDPSIPASDWTSDQRAQYQAVGTAMRNAADQLVALAKQTPHRVVRELYEVTIAYGRSYANAIPTYTAPDDHLALVAVNAISALKNLCYAVSQGSASAWGPAVPPAAPPAHSAAPYDLANPQPFLTVRDPICDDWTNLSDRYNADIAAWASIDSRIAATQWTPQQKEVNDAVRPVMSTYAENIEALSRRTSNATIQDFGALSAQYLRAYVNALPTYVPADSFLSATAHVTVPIVTQACQSIRG